MTAVSLVSFLHVPNNNPWQGVQPCAGCVAIQAADPLLLGIHGSDKSFISSIKVYI